MVRRLCTLGFWAVSWLMVHPCLAATASGDFDNDGDVDQIDRARMVLCRSRAGVPVNPTPNCQAADLDFDGDVDMDDFGIFQRCYSGTGVPADPNCARDTAFVKNGTLYVNGSGAGTKITLRLRSGLPTFLDIDLGDDSTADFTFDRATFDHIVVNAGGGDDVVRIDQANGAFTDTEITTLNGDDGNDTLTGGSGAETLNGGRGNDTIRGGQGNDLLIGGEDADTFVWNPGDGSDTIEGQGGSDVLQFNGANVNENIDISANGTRLRFFRDIANVTLDVDGVEQVNYQALGGTDNVTVNNLAGTAVTQVNVDLAGIAGTTTGDGAADSVIINGPAGVDTIGVAGNAGAVVVSGLTATINVTNGEAALDRVLINGLGPDVVNVNGSDAADTMTYLPASTANTLRVTSSSFSIPVDLAGSMSLSINGLGGNDTISGSGNVAALVSSVGNPSAPLTTLQIDGGDGNDTISGSNAAEVLLGGAGNDTIDGNQGNDLVFGGPDADTFLWDPGDGSDTIEGEGGFDILQFNMANVSEHVDLSANGSRLRLTRDIGNIVMDVNGVEQVNLPTLGGTDNVTINNLAGTGVSQVNVDLAASGGSGDSAADIVTVNGSAAADAINITTFGGVISVNGLTPSVGITRAEPTLDSLIINGMGGTDTFSVGPGVTALILLTTNQ